MADAVVLERATLVDIVSRTTASISRMGPTSPTLEAKQKIEQSYGVLYENADRGANININELQWQTPRSFQE